MISQSNTVMSKGNADEQSTSVNCASNGGEK